VAEQSADGRGLEEVGVVAHLDVVSTVDRHQQFVGAGAETCAGRHVVRPLTHQIAQGATARYRAPAGLTVDVLSRIPVLTTMSSSHQRPESQRSSAS
jgi:hypothetical protein